MADKNGIFIYELFILAMKNENVSHITPERLNNGTSKIILKT
jgi:hypothetical protein